MNVATEKGWGRSLNARLRTVCELVSKGDLKLDPEPGLKLGDVGFEELTGVFQNFPPRIHNNIVGRVLDERGALGIDRQVVVEDIDLAEYSGATAGLMAEGLIRIDPAGVLCFENELSTSPVA